MLKQKVKTVTIYAVLVWVPACIVIASGLISPDDINLFRSLGSPTANDGY